MALYTQAQIAAAINNPYIDPGIIFDNLAGVAQVGDETYLVFNNMEYVAGETPMFYQEVALDVYEGVTPTATELMVPQAVVDSQTGIVQGTTAVKMPATTTGAGSVKAGALAGRVPLGTLIAGVAIGAGVGLKEVATHPQFWNDLSEAVFNDLKSPDAYIAKPFAYNETKNIIWRMLQDGSIQSYCDKRSIDKIVENLYNMDAFNVFDHIHQDITTAGYQDVNVGALDSGYIVTAAGMVSLPSQSIAGVYSAAHLRYPNANVLVCNVTKRTDTLQGSCNVDAYYIEPGEYNVNVDGAVSIRISNDNKMGRTTANIDVDGSITRIAYIDGAGSNDAYIGYYQYSGENSNTAITSNLGATFIPKNDNVIYNGTDLLPPTDPSQFWTTFSDWLDNAFTLQTYDPFNNQLVDTIYLPFSAPDTNWQTDPITAPQTQPWTGIYPFAEPFTDPTTDPVPNPSPWPFPSIGDWEYPLPETPDPTPWDNNPKFPQPTPTPVGSTPTIAVPTSGVGTGNKLYTVYNPTQAEVDALGGYLWTQNIIEMISQFFKNNPLEAIISLHMIYCTPSTGTSKHIILGYLDSGVSAATVTSQYEDLTCGYVDIPEMYGNVLDYTGVSLQVFLPFIGYRTLKTRDCMGKRLEIDYKIDVYTGVCLAMLYVISPNTRQLLYTFEGNCSVQIPLTAADRTRLLAGLTTAGVSAFTGNPAGVVGGIASIGTSIDRSGSFSGNAGAMNVKKPFIIITRPINAQASHYNTLYGYPLNKYGYLRNFRGFTRVQSVHADISGATDTEKRMIESLLKNGIII